MHRQKVTLLDEAKFAKLVFKLKIDQDGYPPVGYESLWAIKLDDGLYQIDNIPLYVYGVSKGDFVFAHQDGDELHAKEVKRRGGHSTLRVFIEDHKYRARVAKTIEQFGAKASITKDLSLFALDIPPDVDFTPIDNYLISICNGETIAYEDACLQHIGIEEPRVNECNKLSTI